MRPVVFFLGMALATLSFAGAAVAQENPDPSLLGVSRSQIQSSGLPSGLITSARGVNQVGGLQIPRSGFDLINNGTTGTVLLRGVRLFPNPANCNALLDDAFFLVTVAGRPGDADGDGAFSTNTGLCASRRGNIPGNPKIVDGISANDPGLFTFGENLRIRLDRNCDGKADVTFSLSTDPTVPTFLRVENDDLTGHGGQNLGGRTVAWETATYPSIAYGQPCPDPATITGYYLIRIPNFSSYFAAPGLSPTDFGFIITAGSDDDGLGEDLIQGEVHKPEVRLSITKTPDLALCPAEEGNWTIHVSNDGNVKLSNLVVTDALPAGVTFVQVVSGGVTASGTSTLTFSPFDLGQCESKDIVLRVRANDNCAGNGINSASVAGVFRTLCDPSHPGQLSEHPIAAGPATASFTCRVRPCVSIVVNPLPAQCPGTAVTVTGVATNCSNGPARLFVRLDGPGVNLTTEQRTALAPARETLPVVGVELDLGIVPPNGQVPFSLPAGTLECSTGGATYTISARADAEGEPDCPGTTDSKTVTVLCKSCETPCLVTTTIQSNFNGTSIVGVGNKPAYVWFNSNFKVTGTITPGTQIRVRQSVVVINGTSYVVPDATITFQAVSCASTSFDPLTKMWSTTVPLAGSDEIFLTGLVLPLLSLQGGARVSWSGTLETSTPGICVSWKWGAAVYKSWPLVGADPFAVDYNAANIKATHSAACNINNGDHAGTPQNPAVRGSVTGGARGGGGSNFTGSWSGTASACLACPPEGAGRLPSPKYGLDSDVQVTDAGVNPLELRAPNPNPFMEHTTVEYTVGNSGQRVTISIFNVAGRLVRSLVDGVLPAGRYEASWDGRSQDGTQVARGIYFLRANVGGQRVAVAPRILYLK